MAEPFKSLLEVFPVILREADGARQALLHRRANTGYMGDLWDSSGGGDVAREALCRECRAELSIEAAPADLKFAHPSRRMAQAAFSPAVTSILW